MKGLNARSCDMCHSLIKEDKEFLGGLPDLLKGSLDLERYHERLTLLLYAEEYTKEKELEGQCVEHAEVWTS